VALLALLACPSPARAFCRAVTASPPAGYDPATNGCFGFADGGVTSGLYPLFWRNACVSYSFQSAPSKYLTLDQAKMVASAAFGAWSSASCPGGPPSITATLFPDVACDAVPSTEHSNVIIFRDQSWPYDDSANAIGYTTLTVDLASGEILGADTEINSAQWTIVAEPPAPPVPPGTYDFATIMTHEAGHFLGLAHTGDATAVMYAQYHPATSLQPDDVAAICSIYFPDGTHATSAGPYLADSCDPTPPAGFLAGSCGSFDAGTVNVYTVGSGPNPSTDGLGVACPGDDSGCSAAAGSRPWGLGSAAAGLVAAATVVRLWRRTRRKRVAAALGIALAASGASAVGEREAKATVSAAASFDDLVKDASAVAVVTPLEQRASWEGNRIVTQTRVRIDRLVAGALPAEAWVRTHGGSVGHIGQIVEGQPSFAVGQASLLFLRPHVDSATGAVASTFVVVASAQGQFPIAAAGQPARLVRAPNVGAIVDAPGKTVGTQRTQLASAVLEGRSLDDAACAIAAAFHRLHA
jgi:hypothetical protein